MQDVVCFYHKDCFDGLGAAYAVYRRFPKAKFIPIHYGDAVCMEDLAGKDVVVVDFSFSLDQSLAIIAVAKSFTVLDHHRTFEPIATDLETRKAMGTFNIPVTIVYDVNRSGALITWEHFHDEPAPQLTQIISDRDLWQFKLPYTREVMAAVGLTPYTLEDYIELYREFNLNRMLDTGSVIVRKNNRDAENIIRTATRHIRIEGILVPLVNCPYYLASDVLAKLCEKHPFAVSYFDNEEERVFSIRAAKDSGYDVSEIAKKMGGGGHKEAAGWRKPRYEQLARM
jgi:uncharacterized protein